MAEVIVSSVGYLRQSIKAGKHALIADEPLEAGGTDEGPGPYELLLASLGACTAMTLQIYARRKGWPLESIEVSLTHERIHAQDCLECEAGEGKITRIERYISLIGELSEDQKGKLLEIATKCPAHQTLTSEILIKDYLD